MPSKNPYSLQISKYSTHGVILSQIPMSGSILDIGCNDGYFARIASNRSRKFYGIDYSSTSIKKAKEYCIKTSVIDLNKTTTLPWNIKADCIIFADILEHLHDPKKVLSEIVDNHLKEKGIVIISLPNIANWLIRINLLLGKFDSTNSGIMDRTHLQFFTYKTASEFVKNTIPDYSIKYYYGASKLGYIINLFPILRNLLATGIVLHLQKK